MSKSKFSASEWKLVKDAPYWVYQALSKADGAVPVITSRQESKAFDKAISSYRSTNALVKDLKANSSPDAAVNKASEADAIQSLTNIAGLASMNLNAREIKSLKIFLMDIANAVAEASGEGLYGSGDRVSKKEAAAIDKIEAALDATAQAVQVEERREKTMARRSQSSVTAARKKETQRNAKLAEMKKREAKMKEAAAARKAAASAEKRKQAADTRKTKAAAATAKVAAAKKAADAAEMERKKLEAAEIKREKRAQAAAKVRADRAKVARQAKLKKEAEAKAKWDAEQKIKEENRAKWMAEQAEKDRWLGEHTVAAGDNLGAISLKYYNSAAKHMWMRIYEANKHIIGANPNMIQIGQVLKIPK